MAMNTSGIARCATPALDVGIPVHHEKVEDLESGHIHKPG